MALNYKSGDQTQSAISSSSSGSAIDLRGYSKLATHTVFATCTGTSNTASLVVQTSNDAVNWTTIITIWNHADVEDASTDKYFDYIPDGAGGLLSGFGRYIRFRFIAAATYAATYTIFYEAKE